MSSSPTLDTAAAASARARRVASEAPAGGLCCWAGSVWGLTGLASRILSVGVYQPLMAWKVIDTSGLQLKRNGYKAARRR